MKQDRQGAATSGDRSEELLTDAASFFEACLWERSGEAARRVLIGERGVSEETLRAFGVGFAPVSAGLQLEHLRELGYGDEEIEAAGLASRSPRGRIHAQFHSRVMFPVRDRDGRTLGFAGLGTHVGPSWALWITSPDAGPYRRSAAVFGLDRAAKRIASSKTARVQRDCIEVLLAHQGGARNAVAVHTGSLTAEQVAALGALLRGGAEELRLELEPGISIEPEHEPDGSGAPAAAEVRADAPRPEDAPHFELKKLALVSATAVAAMNTWTGAPLLAVWLGSQAQGGKVLSLWGVVTVLVAMSALVFALAWILTWLNARYDRLTGRPPVASQTSPWHRAKRGDRVQDIRSRYGVSAPEKAVVGCVVAGVLALEVWFFLFAGAPF